MDETLKFPYGLADFQALRRSGYVYVDRTAYLRLVEDMGRSLLFVRPRRFGKSLWLQTQAAWYDLRTAEHHASLFGNLDADQHETQTAHQYFVLIWNFSKIPTQASGLVKSVEEVGARLEDYITGTLESFAMDYREWLPEPLEIAEHPRPHLGQSARPGAKDSLSTVPAHR